jgi:hypothetical protein
MRTKPSTLTANNRGERNLTRLMRRLICPVVAAILHTRRPIDFARACHPHGDD